MEKVFGTGSSIAVTECQSCGSKNLKSIVFMGYLPPVNTMSRIGTPLLEEAHYPAEIFQCDDCLLVQIGCVVDASILFPKSYAYTSSTTRVLRDNFKELSEEMASLFQIQPKDLMVDIGSNDGNLLSNFTSKCRVLGVTPEDIAKIAIEKGVPTLQAYFNRETVDEIIQTHGQPRFISATNVFAHIEQINSIVKEVARLLDPRGVFVCEFHYWPKLVDRLQYDTIYHEHLRYYSLTSFQKLMARHELDCFRAKEIPTHGGSMRVYVSKRGVHPIDVSISKTLLSEKSYASAEGLNDFKKKVADSKLGILALLKDLKSKNQKISAIGAPSRASTLVHYLGLDETMIDAVYEISGSQKIGKRMPGTLIPVVDESAISKDNPDVLFLFSWHLADEIIQVFRKKGFKGDFLVPLPRPQIISL